MKTILRGLALLVGLAVFGVIVLMTVGSFRLRSPLDVPEHGPPGLPSDSASLVEGERLAQVFVCAECHGDGLEGADFLDGGPFMKLPAPNLTGGRFTNLELERAIRHGVGADGRTLIIMPSEAFESMSDGDLSQLLAYIQSLPSVETPLITRSVGPIGRVVGAFQAPTLQPSRAIRQTAEHGAVSTEPGEYYATMCGACHGTDLGGRMFAAEQPIWAPNLTSHPTGLAGWSAEEFDAAVRRGLRPDGTELDPAAMPWRGFSGLTDDEMDAIWTYLGQMEPVDRSAPTGE